MAHAHTQTHHFNLGRVIAAFNYTSLSSFFWEIQKLFWQSFGLALRIYLLYFSHPSPVHHLMFDQKISQMMDHVTRFLHCSRIFQGSSLDPLRTEERMNLS